MESSPSSQAFARLPFPCSFILPLFQSFLSFLSCFFSSLLISVCCRYFFSSFLLSVVLFFMYIFLYFFLSLRALFICAFP